MGVNDDVSGGEGAQEEDPNPKPTVLTSRNCGTLTTFQIRQELVARDALDIPDKEINHRSMLKRLVAELVKQEQVNFEQATDTEAAKRDAEMAARKTERDVKKEEAIARSKARQADKEYFKKKQEVCVLCPVSCVLCPALSVWPSGLPASVEHTLQHPTLPPAFTHPPSNTLLYHPLSPTPPPTPL